MELEDRWLQYMGQKDQIRLDSRGGDRGGLMRNGRRGGCTWRRGL